MKGIEYRLSVIRSSLSQFPGNLDWNVEGNYPRHITLWERVRVAEAALRNVLYSLRIYFAADPTLFMKVRAASSRNLISRGYRGSFLVNWGNRAIDSWPFVSEFAISCFSSLTIPRLRNGVDINCLGAAGLVWGKRGRLVAPEKKESVEKCQPLISQTACLETLIGKKLRNSRERLQFVRLQTFVLRYKILSPAFFCYTTSWELFLSFFFFFSSYFLIRF